MIDQSSSDAAGRTASDRERQKAEDAVKTLGNFTLGAIQLAAGLLLAGNVVVIIGTVAVTVAHRSWDDVPNTTFVLSLVVTTLVSFKLFQWSNRTISALDESEIPPD